MSLPEDILSEILPYLDVETATKFYFLLRNKKLTTDPKSWAIRAERDLKIPRDIFTYLWTTLSKCRYASNFRYIVARDILNLFPPTTNRKSVHRFLGEIRWDTRGDRHDTKDTFLTGLKPIIIRLESESDLFKVWLRMIMSYFDKHRISVPFPSSCFRDRKFEEKGDTHEIAAIWAYYILMLERRNAHHSQKFTFWKIWEILKHSPIGLYRFMETVRSWKCLCTSCNNESLIFNRYCGDHSFMGAQYEFPLLSPFHKYKYPAFLRKDKPRPKLNFAGIELDT